MSDLMTTNNSLLPRYSYIYAFTNNGVKKVYPYVLTEVNGIPTWKRVIEYKKTENGWFRANNFGRSTLLTGSGTFTVPEAVRNMSIVLIGGGQGGQGGYQGEKGEDGYLAYYSEEYSIYEGYGGEGGRAGGGGQGGSGGKIYTTTLTVTPGQTFNYSCGDGGTGSPSGHTYGALGGNTTFGTFSSVNGAPNNNGITDLITGITYGKKGNWGNQGAAGGHGANGSSWYEYMIASPGENIGTGIGGAGGKSAKGYPDYYYYGGGGGGGAAINANGDNGHDAVSSIPGLGGWGANATVPGTDATVYGFGGNGGNGGGGGGGGGGFYVYTYTEEGGAGRAGGAGSAGGKGAAGCIIIYY